MNNTMKQQFVMVLMVAAIAATPLAFAQENETDTTTDIPIEFTASEGVVILLGLAAGLTTAYLRMRAGRAKALADGKEWKFDATRFIDRVVMAVLASIPLALGAAADIVTLNAFTMIMIYLASLGSSELILELREKNAIKKG